MDARPWLDQFRAELVNRNLPPLYVERLLSELSDHITDSVEDPMSTDAKDLRLVAAQRLGSPREIAVTAAKEYRKSHFCRRHPILSFLVLPIIALPLLWASAVAMFIAVLSLVQYCEPEVAQIQWAGPVLPFVLSVMLLLPVGLAAALFCRLGRRAEIGWRWPLVACVLLAALSGPAMVDAGLRGSHPRGVLHGTRYKAPTDKQGHGYVAKEKVHGYLSFGFGLNKYPSLVQTMQFALPLAICAWAISRQLATRRKAVFG